MLSFQLAKFISRFLDDASRSRFIAHENALPARGCQAFVAHRYQTFFRRKISLFHGTFIGGIGIQSHSIISPKWPVSILPHRMHGHSTPPFGVRRSSFRWQPCLRQSSCRIHRTMRWGVTMGRLSLILIR